MVRCEVIVVRGKAGDSRGWGTFEFLALPSPGDQVMIERDNREHYATVLSVHHYPSTAGDAGIPTADVVVKWTGSGQKIRQ